MKTTNWMYVFCAFFFFPTTICAMYHITTRKKFDYATHRMVQVMGIYALPLTGFMTMIEKYQKGHSTSDAAISFLIPTGIQAGSSAIRSTFNQMVDFQVHPGLTWYGRNSFNKSMVIMITLLIKQKTCDVVENYYHRK